MSTVAPKLQRHEWSTCRGDWPGTWSGNGLRFPARFSFGGRWVFLGQCDTREQAVELKRLADGLPLAQQQRIAEAPTPGVRRALLARLTA